MKNLLCMAFAFIFVFVGVNVNFAQQRAASIEQEKAEIKKTFQDEAQAWNDFTRTHDVEGSLRFYAKEYSEIRDGKMETLSELKQDLEIVLQQLKLGRPYVFFAQCSNISVDVNGSVAWATYDGTVKYGSREDSTTTRHEKCTSILKRNGSSWLFVHDHCSTVKEIRSTSPRMDNN